MTSAWGSDEKLKQELSKLKGIVIKKRVKGTGVVAYSDVIWFLLDYYKERG